MKNEIVRLGVILLIITAIAATLLGFVNQVTSPVIDAQIIEANNLARKSILTQADSFELINDDFGEGVEEVYKALKGSEIVGYTIKTKPKGYGGAIEVTTGITVEGTISGVSIGTMNETPGLGAKAKDESFISQYADKLVNDNITVIKNGEPEDNEIIAISGATITSLAVTSGINKSIEIYKNNLQ